MMKEKQVYEICAVVLLLSAIAELFGIHLHSPKWWPFPVGYNIFFGFVGAWALIIVSKMIMMPILQRKENYYEDGSDDDE